MRFAVGLPNLHDYAEPGRLVALAQAAETAGWDGCFIWDHLAYRDPPAPAADPQVVLGAIAVSTSRIRIGALLTPLARRRPSVRDTRFTPRPLQRPRIRSALADYEAAGLTWYVEKLGWWSGSVDDVAAVIRRGPPRR